MEKPAIAIASLALGIIIGFVAGFLTAVASMTEGGRSKKDKGNR